MNHKLTARCDVPETAAAVPVSLLATAFAIFIAYLWFAGPHI
jgi:hypothetical protein